MRPIWYYSFLPSPLRGCLKRWGPLLIGGLLLILWGEVPAARAQVQSRPVVANIQRIPRAAVMDLDDICVLDPGDYATHTQVAGPDALPRAKAVTANIEVTYNGFTPEAQAAFERAVDIWETHIASDVTIRVEASFQTLEEDVLGSAGPTSIFIAEVDGQQSVYSNALIDAISRTDQTPEDPDIVAQFSSNASWYFGPPPPEGPGPAADEFDFTSIVLHELGHGLNFFGSMSVSEGQGDWDYSDEVAAQGGDPAPWENVPAIYDRLAVDDAETLLINTNTYPNPSSALANALTSENVFSTGLQTDIGAATESGPVPPELYAPSEWQDGSSYSHLDEFTYLAGDPNSLMTPQVGRAEVIQTPGPIMCGMLGDMGWPLGPDCSAYLNVEVAGFEGTKQSGGGITLSWTEIAGADIDRYIVDGKYFDGSFERLDVPIPSQGPQEYTLPLSTEDLRQLRTGALSEGETQGLPVAGNYAFRLRFVRPDGREAVVSEAELTVGLDEAQVSTLYPNPFAGEVRLSLAVQRTQRVRVVVFNALGQQVAEIYDRERPPNDPRPVTFDASRFGTLSSGRYFFRVIGEDFVETRSAVFVR